MAGFSFKSLEWLSTGRMQFSRLSCYASEISGGKRVRNSKSCHKGCVFTFVEYTFVSSGFTRCDTFARNTICWCWDVPKR